jgi:hypothetical protein
MKDRSTTLLAKPKTRGSNAFKAALDPLKTNPHFAQVGIGVIDFTRDHNAPDIWLFNEDKAYRIGSATKIAILLAATQLRCDVRKILDLHIISTPAEFDALFSNKKLWEKAKAPKPEMKDPSSIVVGATARTPLTGPILDDVVIGMDEDANLVWRSSRSSPAEPSPLRCRRPSRLPARAIRAWHRRTPTCR